MSISLRLLIAMLMGMSVSALAAATHMLGSELIEYYNSFESIKLTPLGWTMLLTWLGSAAFVFVKTGE